MNPIMNQDIEQLIHDVLHGQATAEDAQRLSDWIASSKDNARVYYRVLSDERAIQRCLEQDSARAVDHVSSHPDDSAAGLVLAELAEAEANAEASVVEWVEIKDRRWRVGSMQYAWAAMIAIATLTAVVVMLLAGPKDSSTPSPFVEGPSQKVPTQTMARQAVATLTNTSDAQWAGRAFAPGSELKPGQRLTLTAGFAEITTNDGAVAILTAPATVEMIDSPNALRLHTGKLVGICETDSSKGFLVRTPHMDVTDLGTRFGVDASASDLTQVHVIEGEVRVARVGVDPVFLTENQSAQASGDSSSITAIQSAAERFDAILEESGLGNRIVVLDTDIAGRQWLMGLSDIHRRGDVGFLDYAGSQVTCTVDHRGFTRGIGHGNAYGFIQYSARGVGAGQPATATGTWTFSNLPAGRYDVATAFEPKNSSADSVRYTVNGVEVMVDQSLVPAPDAGPTFGRGLKTYSYRTTEILFIQLRSSITVPEGGSITVRIDNSNLAPKTLAAMDTVAISLAPEAGPN